MTEIPADEGIMRARSQIGIELHEPASAWYIRRIDREDGAYYLIVFGDAQAAVAVAAVDAVSGEIEASAVLPGMGPHLTIDANEAMRRAALSGAARAELVWRPCRNSLSPLYPIWHVYSGTTEVYVDQQGIVCKSLEPPVHGA